MSGKIKAINPEIIVKGCADKPYYQIKYYGTADKRYHIGYGSYCYGNVIEWLKEYFEPIQADEQPVVFGHWERIDDPEFICGDFECSNCSHREYEIDTDDCTPGVNCLHYCPNCGAKMDEQEDNQ